MALSAFSPPGFVDDLSPTGASAWSADVAAIFTELADGEDHPQFFNPMATELAADATSKVMRWGAFPRKLARVVGEQRLRLGEERNRQEEYCEWAAVRDRNNRIVKAFFTTEVPTYYHRLANDNPETLLAVYRNNVDERARLRDLVTPTGSYIADNPWNRLGAMHMIQPNNTLNAAVVLAAQATVARVRGGNRITNSADLIRCGVAADADRNSDPLIVGEVNALARTGALVSLADPVGLYLDSLQTTGWSAPKDSDPASFWTVTRGADGHGVRAVYEVPESAGFTVSDITIDGDPITSPSQIAEHIQIKLVGTAHRIGAAEPVERPCRGGQLEAVGPPPTMTELLAAARRTRG
jgi:hypothetical protein